MFTLRAEARPYFSGFDLAGFNFSGFNQNGIDRLGFNYYGFNHFGFNLHGYDREGYNIDGFNKTGFNRAGRKQSDFKDSADNFISIDIDDDDEVVPVAPIVRGPKAVCTFWQRGRCTNGAKCRFRHSDQ